jgi:6-phosphogluconolactonase (cycloisomerase 2 family)
MDGNPRPKLGSSPAFGSRKMPEHVHMEIKRRMRIRLTSIAAVLTLVAIAFLMSCSSKYSSSSDGLVIVPTQGTIESPQSTAVMETFTLDLTNGSMSQINNVNGPPTQGLPSSVIINPAGTYAYVIVTETTEFLSQTGVTAFPIGSDGKLGTGTTTTLNDTAVTINGVCESVPVAPAALAIDSAGAFLFVADSATSDSSSNPVPGSVSVLAVGTSGSLTEVNPTSCQNPTVAGSPFPLPVAPGGSTASASALAVSRTIYPLQYSYCSGHTAPTTENLYVTDSVNYTLLNYSVDPTAGTLTLMPYSSSAPGIPTGSIPSGVAVDPCDRFVYVANSGPGSNQNTVSAFTICSAINLLSQPPCPNADFSLHSVGSPYPAGDVPGPMAVDAYGKFLYVVNKGSNNISGYEINSNTGALIPFSGAAVAAGVGANSIAIRSDDSWMFVANTGYPGTLSQYAISLTSGILNPVGPVSTLDYPSGVAVK